MIVKYTDNDTIIASMARQISASSADEGFSIQDLVQKTGIEMDSVRSLLRELVEMDWCARLAYDWRNPATPDERWILRHHSLTIGQDYEVLGIEADMYRILNDGGEPVLFHPLLFHIIDPAEPSFWTCEIGEEGERYCYPAEWKGCFFEGFFDRKETARETFAKVLQKYYPDSYRRFSN